MKSDLRSAWDAAKIYAAVANLVLGTATGAMLAAAYFLDRPAPAAATGIAAHQNNQPLKCALSS
jgi:hypothetical protein